MPSSIQPRRTLVSAAVAAALVSSPAIAQQLAIEEITVTATKRAESMQDIPLAVQAMGAVQLEQQNIQSFADYVMFLPNVNAGGRGPGQNEIYIRGAAVDAINITVAESQGSAPNVALYLDEQPVTVGGRNLDVYVTDMERIEVLPGPQGTLYGASSMAGTVRLITNKPVLDQFQASVNGSWSMTSGGEDSNSLEAMLNVPVIEGKFALRAALYNEHQPDVPGRYRFLRRGHRVRGRHRRRSRWGHDTGQKGGRQQFRAHERRLQHGYVQRNPAGRQVHL
jgi:outer membrane receptor protein involved in Fe transport